MPWIVFSILSVFSVSIAYVLQKTLMREEDSDPVLAATIFQLLVAGIVGIFALWKGFHALPIAQLPLNFFLMAVLYGVGTVLSFKALQYIEASEATIITASRSLITIISAILLLHETFNPQRLLGTAVIIIGIILVSKKAHKFTFNKGAVYAFFAAACFGLAITNDAYILKLTNDVLSYTALAFLLPGLFLIVVQPKSLLKIKPFLKTKKLLTMLLFSTFYAIAALSFYTAIQIGGNASQVGPINQASVIVTVLLAAIFLRERDHLVKKVISAVLVIVGVILLS